GGAGRGSWRARARAAPDRRLVARARRHCHRPGGGASTRRPRDFRRAAGRRAHPAPRLPAPRSGPGPRPRGRADDGRVHARDDAGGNGRRRARRRRGVDRRSLQSVDKLRAGGRSRSALLDFTEDRSAHVRAGRLSAVRARSPGRETGVQTGCDIDGRRKGRRHKGQNGHEGEAEQGSFFVSFVFVVLTYMSTFKITVAYDGTNYIGWQRQAEGTSIQGLIEDALHALDGRDVTVIGAGRTDAGV